MALERVGQLHPPPLLPFLTAPQSVFEPPPHTLSESLVMILATSGINSSSHGHGSPVPIHDSRGPSAGGPRAWEPAPLSQKPWFLDPSGTMGVGWGLCWGAGPPESWQSGSCAGPGMAPCEG